MDMLKKVGKGLASTFWVNNNPSPEETPPENPKETPSKEPAPSAAPVMTSGFVAGVGKEDTQIMATLVDALTKASNKNTYDYLKFAQSVSEQAKFIPGEETRFQATFAVARSLGVTQASLVSDATRYLDILKQEQSKFDTSVAGLTAQNISSKESDLASIDQQTAEKAAQIKKLTEEINDLQGQKMAIINEVSQSKAKITQMKNNFAITMKTVADRITEDIEKIKKYIPA
jgi:hypothetical protein